MLRNYKYKIKVHLSGLKYIKVTKVGTKYKITTDKILNREIYRICENLKNESFSKR